MTGFPEEKNGIPIPKCTFYSCELKRLFDIVLSSLALVCLSPLFVVLCILELIFHGKPVFYGTKRPGKNGEIFHLYKFRSMTNECDNDGWLLSEEKRLTKFGHFIRKTSLDELPELLNIIKGDMSIIGPRPLLVEYLPLYSERHAMRHAVRPGFACPRITPTDSKTWTWGEQFENDIWYIENVSFAVDIKMIFATAKEALKGAEYRANDTRVPFDGNNLNETRSKDEIEEYIRYDSVSK